jgi:ADP-ribose pyrophosphatase
LEKRPGYVKEESKEIFDGRIITVRLDRIRFDDGQEMEMELVSHPGAAAVVPLLDNGRVVLIRQYRYTVDKYIWEIPAGRFNDREDSLSCAAREMEEEVGYRAGKILKLGSILTTPGFSDERIDIFLAKDLVKAERHLDPDEFIDVEDVTLDEALEMIARGEIEDSKTLIALFLTARKLRGGWSG